ncbi:hypothetical protein KFF05_03920 [bacterium SCSIO 12827]|nr:hypothetical protein KFF05_03920 [bacterium SCSIO 12827]
MLKVCGLASVCAALSLQAIAGTNVQGELPACTDGAIKAKADEALNAWFRGTGIEWEGSGYKAQMMPALQAFKEKHLEKSAVLSVKVAVSKEISAKLRPVSASDVNIKFCDATVDGIWVQTMLIQDPVDQKNWGLVVQSNVRNLKFVPAPGFASLIFLK